MSYLPSNVTDCVIEASMALDKGKLILGDLTTEYPFDADPNEKIQGWRFEYGRITTFMGIVLDYVAEASQQLGRAREIEERSRAEKVTEAKDGVVA